MECCYVPMHCHCLPFLWCPRSALVALRAGSAPITPEGLGGAADRNSFCHQHVVPLGALFRPSLGC